MKNIAIAFLLMIMFVLAWVNIRNRKGINQPEELKQMSLQPAERVCDTDPQVQAWDENWDANNKYFVAQFGSKEGLHKHHVEQCMANARSPQ